MDGFIPPFRKDRNLNGAGAALYVREDVPSRLISFKNDDKDIEHLFKKSTSARKSGRFHVHITLTCSS